MTERVADRIEREMEQGQLDARRTLSRYYLAEIDRINEEFLGHPDDRPNSGLREGDLDHAEVNAVIRRAEKTVIFGQQTRLRAGILMKEDERLSRFHAGHEVVRYLGSFTGQSRSTRVVAEEGCVVMMLGNDVWAEIFASDPDVGIKMQSGLIKDLYARIHDMNQELRALRRQDRGE